MLEIVFTRWSNIYKPTINKSHLHTVCMKIIHMYSIHFNVNYYLVMGQRSHTNILTQRYYMHVHIPYISMTTYDTYPLMVEAMNTR